MNHLEDDDVANILAQLRCRKMTENQTQSGGGPQGPPQSGHLTHLQPASVFHRWLSTIKPSPYQEEHLAPLVMTLTRLCVFKQHLKTSASRSLNQSDNGCLRILNHSRRKATWSSLRNTSWIMSQNLVTGNRVLQQIECSQGASLGRLCQSHSYVTMGSKRGLRICGEKKRR